MGEDPGPARSDTLDFGLNYASSPGEGYSDELVGWVSTATFLFSILLKQRLRLHEWGMFTSVTTGGYTYAHGATAIWLKWFIAFFFHAYMSRRLRVDRNPAGSTSLPQSEN